MAKVELKKGTMQEWATDRDFGTIDEKYMNTPTIWFNGQNSYYTLEAIQNIIVRENSDSDTIVCARIALKNSLNLTKKQFEEISSFFGVTLTPADEEHGTFKKYANYHMFSDVEPYEVIKVISDKTLEIREMSYELKNKEELHFCIGGFAGHCTNQHSQEYNITSNEKGRILRIRKKKNGSWGAGNKTFILSNTPIRFHDFNF